MKFARLVALCVVSCFSLYSQTTTGSITATVVDPSGAAVAGASVTLTDEQRSSTQTMASEDTGRFAFSTLIPSQYTISIKAPGFKTLDRRNVVLNANDRLTLGNLSLEVGNTSESIEVTAETQALKTESAERSDILVNKQIKNIAVNGRSYLALVALTPGVVSTGNFEVAGTAIGGISANGTRGNQNQLTVNGVGNVDTGNNGDQLATVSLDSVQEYRILSGTYQAEYGRSAGAQISVVTKSGTNAFHGSGYYYRRHDSMNANDWLSNRDGRPRRRYRFNIPGYTIGGPVYIPGKFNKDKDRIFFFWSQEFQDQLQPEDVRRVTVPTALERQGDFSQSIDRSGNRVTILDPVSRQPFAGNRIPLNRINPSGAALLNFFPLPTTNKNVTREYNFESQISTARPRREDTFRGDVNITDKLRSFVHYINNNNSVTSPYGSFVLGGNLANVPITDARPGRSIGVGLTAIINPTTTNEFTFGYGKNSIRIAPAGESTALTRQATGINFPVLFPGTVQDNYIPNVEYNGTRINNQSFYTTQRAPFVNFNNTIDIIDNLSKIAGRHVIKTGLYFQYSRKDQSPDGFPNGFYNFGDSPDNPIDSGYGFSNMALGVFRSFQQNSDYSLGQYRYRNAEGYLQDTWKITNRLTLDYGLRVAWIEPQWDKSLGSSTFLRERWNAAAAPQLYTPVYNAAGARTSVINPVTGQPVDSSLVGRLVPGSGNINNGIARQGFDISKYQMANRGVQWAPRFGIAWDITGKQNFVFRAGGGIFYDRYQGNRVFSARANPPLSLSPQILNGTTNDIANSNPNNLVLAPPRLQVPEFNGQNPTVYNYSAGIQVRLPYQLVLDTSYVGSQSRHLQNQLNLNAVPYRAQFGALNTDQNFFRPFRGYADIILNKSDANANYNSLQVALNRRLANSVFLGVSYTLSRNLTFAPNDDTFSRIDSLTRFANYGLALLHRKHNLVINSIYELPTPFKTNRLSKQVLGNWQLSGIYTYQSGQPDDINYNISGVQSRVLTGSFTENARIRLVSDPIAGINNGPYNKINPAAFGAPGVNSIGLESPARFFIRPGINNTQLSVQKAFTFTERARLQLRADAFNVLNHTQFSDVNRTASFASPNSNVITNAPGVNAQGQFVNIAGFGAVTAVRSPRILQLVVRFEF